MFQNAHKLVYFLFIKVSAFLLDLGQQTLTKAKDVFMEQVV